MAPTNYVPNVAVVASDLSPAPVTGPADLDLVATVGVHGTGRGDPTTIVARHEVWRAARTPDGPGTLHIGARHRLDRPHLGPGRPLAPPASPALLGLHDRPDALVPLTRSWRRPTVATRACASADRGAAPSSPPSWSSG